VTDRDIEAIIESEIADVPEEYTLTYLHVSSGHGTVPTATVRIKHGDEVLEEAASGDGPVDAVMKAIDRATGIQTTLDSYSLQAVTGGKDALGEVVVRIRDNGNEFLGRGTSTDVIEASASAYIHALNKMIHTRR